MEMEPLDSLADPHPPIPALPTDTAAPSASVAPRAAPAVVATAAEGALKIEDREELLYLLTEAAELEHAALVTYLYTAFSLKTALDEGLTPEQLRAVSRWKRAIIEVAVQEMMHLTLASNLLCAVGGAPHFDRPNFPMRSLFAPEIQFSLTPFSEKTLERFLYIERPEGMDIAALAQGFDISGPRWPAVTDDMILPEEQDYSSIGQLYHGVERGLEHLAAKYGEARVFIGPPRAQITTRYVTFTERPADLIAVTDLASARQVIETIVEEGEGARGDWQNAHFGRFLAVLREYRQLKAQDPAFEPARPMVENPYCRLPRGLGLEGDDLTSITILDDPFTREVSDLCNACYESMLQLLNRFFMHTEETDEELNQLCDAAITLMVQAISPLGELLATLPAGPATSGMTAGPNFLASRRMTLAPHKPAAWLIVSERLSELAAYCARLTAQATSTGVPQAAGPLAVAQATLTRLADALAPHGALRG